MSSRFERLIIALAFAILAAGVTLLIASAQEGTNPPAQFTQDCAACHTDFQTTWQSGAHGQAGNDPIFLDEWTKQGKPGACLVCHTTGYDPATATYKAEGVTCESCHNPIPTDHPKSTMPVDRSTDLCGRCHSDTRFGWQDWTVSTHYQRGLACATCHDPHSTSLKTSAVLSEVEKTDQVSQLCVTCHQESSMDFSLTAHAQKNISCADCHVKETANIEGAPHTVPDHSFEASLASCNTCHAQQMHSPTEAVNTKESTLPITNEPTAEVETASVAPEPGPVSPVGFSAMAGLIGLAGGMVLAPWLERWYRRATKSDEEQRDE